MICCPACGYETVDTSRSMAARFASNLFSRNSSKNNKKDRQQKEKRKMAFFGLFTPHRTPAVSTPVSSGVRNTHNLAAVCPGEKAKVTGFSKSITPERRMQLQAYGINPGTWVTVSMHSPVTVLQIEHLEIALETEMARGIEVEG